MHNHGFIVISPQYESYSGNEIDPPEYGCDVVEIECENARDAKSLALRTKEFEKWVMEARWGDINPFSGLKTEPMICEHGKCYCSKCLENGECQECKKLYE